MEIKLELDTEKTVKAAVAIAAAYGLCRVSESTDFSQLATANAFALIIIIVILYGPRPAPKNQLNQQSARYHDTQHDHPPLQRGPRCFPSFLVP